MSPNLPADLFGVMFPPLSRTLPVRVRCPSGPDGVEGAPPRGQDDLTVQVASCLGASASIAVPGRMAWSGSRGGVLEVSVYGQAGIGH